MNFADDSIAEQWNTLEFHPELVSLLHAFESISESTVLPEPVITSLQRPPVPKFSWHHVRCAADIRSHNYKQGAEFRLVWAWLQYRAPKPLWECLYHDQGSGWHFHVARRDDAWRTRYSAPPGG